MKRSAITVGGAVVLFALTVAGPSATAANGSDPQHVQMQDDCDPATFNAALGDGACVGDGDTTFGEFFASLVARDPDGHWRMHPRETHVRQGTNLMISNSGGEFHTFTAVAKFGAGCVPEINDPLGLVGPPAADCGTAFTDPQTALPPGAKGTVRTQTMSPGIHRFQCMIHPWMHSTVEVRRH